MNKTPYKDNLVCSTVTVVIIVFKPNGKLTKWRTYFVAITVCAFYCVLCKNKVTQHNVNFSNKTDKKRVNLKVGTDLYSNQKTGQSR